ncbi:YciI family protein [Demequina sp.]|uniref:YciI family protein n=1 Tax=Demequina sp. TaxID=2050685 RepID=UPI003D14BB21
MKYVMMIVLDPEHSAEDEANAPDIDEWFTYAEERGQYDLGVRLQERSDARTVRVRDGRLMVTDGPFAETRETLAGFALIETDTFEEAVELARRNPASHWGRIELRPVHSFGGPILEQE